MKILSSRARKLFATGTAIAITLSMPLHAADKPVVPEVVDDIAMTADFAPPPKPIGSDPMNPFAGMEDFALKRPIVNLPKPDPARLAIAEQVANALYPDGTSQRMFTSMRTELFQPVLDRFWTMKENEFFELFDIKDMPKKKDKKKKDETLGQAMSKDDPNAKERVEAYVKVYLDLMGEMSAPLDPDWRGAMARDFARRYTAEQLTDMATFFATPSGAAFGRDYWLSSFSLDLIQTSLMNWPKMMKAVPDFAERVKKADAHLPPAPKGSPFAGADLSGLPKCAQDGDENDCTDADWEAWDLENGISDANAAADAAAAVGDAAMAAADAAAYPAYDYDAEQKKQRAAWSKADLKAVEDAEVELEAAYAKHRATLSAAEVKVDTAIEKAMRAAGQWEDDDHHHDGPDDDEM